MVKVLWLKSTIVQQPALTHISPDYCVSELPHRLIVVRQGLLSIAFFLYWK